MRCSPTLLLKASFLFQVGFVEAMFLIQQLLSRVSVLVKPILVLSVRGPYDLRSSVVGQFSEGCSVCLHILTVHGGGDGRFITVESIRSSRVSIKGCLMKMVFIVMMLSRLGILFPWGRLS